MLKPTPSSLDLSALDAAGNARQLTDRNGLATTYEYDTFQRPTLEAWKNGSNQDICELFNGYDVVGNLTTVADNHINPATGVRTQASDTMTFTYTTRDQLDFESQKHLLVGRIPEGKPHDTCRP